MNVLFIDLMKNLLSMQMDLFCIHFKIFNEVEKQVLSQDRVVRDQDRERSRFET